MVPSYCQNGFYDQCGSAEWEAAACQLSDDMADGRQAEPLAQMLAEEFTAAVHRAASRLPARQREVVEMVGLENMAPAQVAERLGVSKNDVYVILHDARNALRKELTRGG